MPSLLETANQAARRMPGSTPLSEHELRERCELALAYASGKVTGTQAGFALNKSNKGNVASALGTALMTAMRRGIVKAEMVAPK